MKSPGRDIVEAAESRIGLPFSDHFKPDNLCGYGSFTVASCMEKGMDENGYDCSGLVVASICEVLRLEPQRWPIQYRHVNQLKELEENRSANAGDALLFYQNQPNRTHMGILASEQIVIHASGISKIVERGMVEGQITRIGVIPAEVLVDLPRRT